MSITLNLVRKVAQAEGQHYHQQGRILAPNGQPILRGNPVISYPGQVARPIYGGQMLSGNDLQTAGLDTGAGGLQAMRRAHAQNVLNHGMHQPHHGASHPQSLQEEVEAARVVKEAGDLANMAEYNWPTELAILPTQTVGAAAALTNSPGITPPRDFYCETITILGADNISITTFNIMGVPLIQGASPAGGTAFRTDTTRPFRVNMVLETVPIIFIGASIAAGTFYVGLQGYLKQAVSSRRNR